MPIITSLLDSDLYKTSMQQAMFHQLPGACGTYKFLCRNKGIDLRPLRDTIEEELDALCELKYTDDELNYLASIRFIKPDFIEFLRLFKLNRNHIKVRERDGVLDIRASGPLYLVSPFEIYVLSIVHELYSLKYNCHEYGQPIVYIERQEGEKRLQEKINMLHDYRTLHGVIPSIIDFGTRRRFLKIWQEHVLKELNDNKLIIGTSNMMFAKKFGITAIGTFAHEWVMLFQGLGLCPLRDSQTRAFQAWQDEYRSDLGICLSDSLGNKKFLKDFDMYFAKLFDGCRHDSGPTYEWGDSLIKHYDQMKIDPKTKSLVFSDGLDIPEAIKIYEYFKDRIKVSFGIGTNLTNDMGVPALQNVMKLIEVNGNPVAKISENPDKTMCENKEFLTYLRSVI